MDIKWAMPKFGFGRRETRHVILDHEGELWLAVAPAAGGGVMPISAFSLPGKLRVEPLENGEIVPFTYTATESLLELTTEKGAKVQFAIDKDAQSIVIKGNTAFRLNAVRSDFFTSTRGTDAGIAINFMAIRYLITIKKGKPTYDDRYLNSMSESITPCIDFEPEGGEIDFCVYDFSGDAETPPESKTIGECAADTAETFKGFIDTLVDIPDEWSDVKEKMAYPIWLCHRRLTGETEVIVANKHNSTATDARLMSIASLAFKDAKKAIDMLLAFPPSLPPVAGIAAARLFDDNMLNDARGDIFRVYEWLETIARKCINKRTVDQEGLSYYAYRYENGVSEAPEFFKAGEPELAPDLNAYLVIAAEMAGKLALLEYDDGVGNKWAAYSKALLTKLVAELWNGEDFIGKNAYSEETSAPDAFLSLVPIVLGSRLPVEIIKKLAAKIEFEAVDSATGFLLAGGLYDAGEADAAKAIAVKALENARAKGIACPFYGASLIALAHKVL